MTSRFERHFYEACSCGPLKSCLQAGCHYTGNAGEPMCGEAPGELNRHFGPEAAVSKTLPTVALARIAQLRAEVERLKSQAKKLDEQARPLEVELDQLLHSDGLGVSKERQFRYVMVEGSPRDQDPAVRKDRLFKITWCEYKRDMAYVDLVEVER